MSCKCTWLSVIMSRGYKPKHNSFTISLEACITIFQTEKNDIALWLKFLKLVCIALALGWVGKGAHNLS